MLINVNQNGSADLSLVVADSTSPEFNESSIIASQLRRSATELNNALEALQYLIIQMHDQPDPVKGVSQCFFRCFEEVQKALIKRELLEGLTEALR
ncbi:hypothetical protein [Streptomyces aureoversilis]|uniref:Uncharacterized protein n=1 Tax=Streptomyces aureoversilis TaxID=67277 RepID=A0ABW0A8H9_9ACTN